MTMEYTICTNCWAVVAVDGKRIASPLPNICSHLSLGVTAKGDSPHRPVPLLEDD